MLQPNYFGAMMVAMHHADGIVSGASHTTGSVLPVLTPRLTRPSGRR